MEHQSILKSTTLERIYRNLIKLEKASVYGRKKGFDFKSEDLLVNSDVEVKDGLSMVMPDAKGHHDFRNAKIIFERYSSLNPVQASDPRLWVYLTHVDCWGYMKARYPHTDKGVDYIAQYWLINGVGPNNLMRNGISRLWWGAYMTYEPDGENPFELTEELFSMLDYTRTLSAGSLGRMRFFTRGFIRFVLEHPDAFSEQKEAKVRFLMRKINERAGFSLIGSWDEDMLKGELFKHLDKFAEIKKR